MGIYTQVGSIEINTCKFMTICVKFNKTYRTMQFYNETRQKIENLEKWGESLGHMLI